LVGGQVALMFDALVTSVPLVKAGRLRAYAVTSESRSSFLPDVPTFRELGYAELEISGWVGVFAPRGLEPALAARINQELVGALALPSVRLRLEGLYFDPSPPSLPAELARALRTEYNRTGGVVKTFDIRPE
jgi:tripartite-type tricarboxylate transporter receptor subunit TctC